jgi:hypothetical protein
MGVVGWLTVRAGSSGSAPKTLPRPAAVPVVTVTAEQAAEWSVTNLPPHTPVFSASSPAGGLAGLRPVTTCPRGGYLLVDAALRSRSAEPEVRHCLARSFTVARFGSGSSSAEVRSIAAKVGAVTNAWRRALAAGRRGGAALAANPYVLASPAVRGQLRAGRLDLRAEALLALLAGRGRIRVLEIIADPAEAAAGRPARFVTVEAAEPVFGVDLTAIAPAYRPSTITRLPGARAGFGWLFEPGPPPILT